MNVTDKWMLEQMQQMAASMATTLPQTGQNSEPAKTDKGESFQDLMNRAKAQQTEAPKEDAAPRKEEDPAKAETSEPAETAEPVQKAEQPQQVRQTQPGRDSVKVNLDVNTAAMIAAGYAEVVEVYEDGSALIMLDAEKLNGGFSIVSGGIPAEGQEFAPVTITDGLGQKITVTPEQIQQVFDRLGVEAPKESADGLRLVGQLDLSKNQDVKVLTTDGQFTTLKEAIRQAQGTQTVREEQASQDPAGQEKEGDDGRKAEVMTAGQPLFKDVEAAPVKVGEHYELDTRREDMEQVLADVVRYASQANVKEVTLMLAPENLGSLTIKVTQSGDGILQVVFHTTTEKAANLLNRHMDSLSALLQGYSPNEVRVEVQRGGESQQAEQQQQQQQADPDGRGQHPHQRQQEQRQDDSHSGDFAQKLRLGLFDLEDMT